MIEVIEPNSQLIREENQDSHACKDGSCVQLLHFLLGRVMIANGLCMYGVAGVESLGGQEGFIGIGGEARRMLASIAVESMHASVYRCGGM